MRKIQILLIVAILVSFIQAAETYYAVQGTVTGRVQKVGFRAFLLKLAIRFNLSGFTENLRNGTVVFRFQGVKAGVIKALSIIKTGNRKARVDVVNNQIVPIDNSVIFRVKNWTSESRNFHTPVDLVFRLRANHTELSYRKTKKLYKRIIKAAMRVRTGVR